MVEPQEHSIETFLCCVPPHYRAVDGYFSLIKLYHCHSARKNRIIFRLCCDKQTYPPPPPHNHQTWPIFIRPPQITHPHVHFEIQKEAWRLSSAINVNRKHIRQNAIKCTILYFSVQISFHRRKRIVMKYTHFISKQKPTH